MNLQRKILFRRIAEGDKAAFDEFFALYYHRLVGFAQLFVKSHFQAEDVVSDVLTAVVTQRERVFAMQNFEGYLYAAVKNKALSMLRHDQVADAYNRHLAVMTTASENGHDVMIAREFQDLVEKVIDGFPPKRRMVFQLLRDEGLSYAEVGELLDISKRTVEVHLRLAIRELREKVDAYRLHDVVTALAR